MKTVTQIEAELKQWEEYAEFNGWDGDAAEAVRDLLVIAINKLKEKAQ